MTESLTVLNPVRLRIFTRDNKCFFGTDDPPTIKVKRKFNHPEAAERYLAKWVNSYLGFILPDAEIEEVSR